MKWLFEGEDRNRFYFWSGSPFYSIQFFTYAMNCPDSQKSRYLLYRRVLEELSPLAAETPDDNVGLPPASRWHGLKRTSKTWIQDWLSASLRRRLKHSLFPRLRSGQAYNPQSLLVRCLREQLDSCDAPGGCLSNATLKSIIDNVRHHSRFEMENLFAVTSWVEELDRGYSSIEPYNDVRFS
jgi:asparagine synthase (glutamine-hydrolysing)